MNSDDDLWFLPGPPEDLAPTDPPWPQAPKPDLPHAQDWQAAPYATELAETAYQLGRLRERMDASSDGLRHRLGLSEICALMALDGTRLGAEQLALYAEARMPGGADAQDLALAHWGLRRWRGRTDPLQDAPGFFDRRARPEFAAEAADWVRAVHAGPTHPLLRAGFAFAQARARGLAGSEFAAPPLIVSALAALCLTPQRLPLGAARRAELHRPEPASWLAAIKRSTDHALMQTALCRDWSDKARALATTRSEHRLLEACLRYPALSVPVAVAATGLSRASCQRGLARLSAAGLLREMTGQTRFRFWQAAL